MTPIADIIARFLPRKAVPFAVFAAYTLILSGILLCFEIRATGIPYADQRDTASWRAPP